ncbi:MAG: hypothetical protein ABI068_00340 [Ktedonobacterales bacterium]
MSGLPVVSGLPVSGDLPAALAHVISAIPALQTIQLNALRLLDLLSLRVNTIYLIGAVLVWLLVYHIVYALTAITRDPSLVCWGVGLFGFTVIGLHRPSWRQVVARLFCAGVALGVVAFITLFIVQPAPISGLPQMLTNRLTLICALVMLATILRLMGAARDWRFPLWGEARVLASVQRSIATGAILFFTPLGRAYLRDRFGATPNEFLQTIRS